MFPGALRPNQVFPGALRSNQLFPGALRPDKLFQGSLRTNQVFPGALRPNQVLPGALRPNKLFLGSLRPNKLVLGSLPRAPWKAISCCRFTRDPSLSHASCNSALRQTEFSYSASFSGSSRFALVSGCVTTQPHLVSANASN